MAAAPKQTITTKQEIKLSPQHIRLMKMMQTSTEEFEACVEEELETNPALVRDDSSGTDLDVSEDLPGAEVLGPISSEVESDGEEGEYGDRVGEPEDDREDGSDAEGEELLDDSLSIFVEEDPAIYGSSDGEHGEEEDEKVIPIRSESTLQEYLEEQLGFYDLNDQRKRKIALQIIGSIDERGYLSRSLEAMVNDLLFQGIQTTQAELEEILHIIQRFDPPGIGARDLRECLLIQLRSKLRDESRSLSPERRAYIAMAIKLIENYFDEFVKKHYPKLAKSLGVEEDTLKLAVREIQKLNPKPASAFVARSEILNNYIVPDFFVTNQDGELELTLNARNAPELRISEHFREMLQSLYKSKSARKMSSKDREALVFIKQKIDSARWFIEAIKQRQHNMMLVMSAILQHQREYFLTGDERKIRPMILKDIADVTGLDISTVSRIVNAKYVQTEFGTKRLKDFFSESLGTQEGDEVSTLEVKKILSELINGENKQRPLSDEKLKEILVKKGYNIARRTVAKYREQLGFPVARLRKEI